MSDHDLKLMEQSQIMVEQCPMTNSNFHCTPSLFANSCLCFEAVQI